MKVKELIKELAEFDDDLEVVMSQDPEGNGFAPLSDLKLSSWDAEYGEVGIPYLTPELEAQGYGPEDVKGKDFACVLWP